MVKIWELECFLYFFWNSFSFYHYTQNVKFHSKSTLTSLLILLVLYNLCMFPI